MLSSQEITSSWVINLGIIGNDLSSSSIWAIQIRVSSTSVQKLNIFLDLEKNLSRLFITNAAIPMKKFYRISKIWVEKLIDSVVGFGKPEFLSNPINKSWSAEIIQTVQIIDYRTSLVKKKVSSSHGFDRSKIGTAN